MTAPDASFFADLGLSPDPLLRPTSVDEVARIISTCAAHHVAVVPAGGQTGLSGGTELAGNRPSIEVRLDRLNSIRSIDPDRWTITVDAGVTVEAVQGAARAVGRQFAPDWGARGSATIGGAISTDAGGNNVIRYGNMRENVLGLEVVLADGTVWDGLRSLSKDSSGYDVKQLFIGGEGTLGVVTGAVLRLVPQTPYRQSALAALAELAALPAVADRVRTQASGTLTAFELLPDEGLRSAAERLSLAHPLPGRSDYHVLLSLSGSTSVTDELAELLEGLAAEGLIADAAVAVSPEQEQALWQLRDVQSPTQSRPELVEQSLKYDAAVPVDRIVALLESISAATSRVAPDAFVHAFGHVGDGNIHVWILPPDADGFAGREELRSEIDDIVIGLDGTLSAEHGVGTLLRGRVGRQKPDIEWHMMREIKHAFDPENLFNPGKMLPDQPPS